jgi:hypothetical protein
MLSFLYRLVTSVWPHKCIYAASNPVPDLEDEWIAVVSDVEDKLTDERKAQVDAELALLRRRNSGGDRAFILGRVSEVFSKRDLSDLTRIVLPADLRRKIYKDVFTRLSPDWLDRIKRIYPDLVDFEANWTPSAYEKNLLGQMIDMAEQTGPDSLSASGFAKMLKNVHLCVTQSLSLLINSPVAPTDSESLLEMLAMSIVPIVDLWLTTARNSQESLSRQGQLPSKWTRELEEREKQLLEKKATGQIDARFVDGEEDELRKRYITRDRIERGLLVSHESMMERQKLIQERLQNRKKKKDREKEAIEVALTNFKERQAQLAKLLKR